MGSGGRAALIEQLAAIEHERWADWQRWVHACGSRQPNGDLLIPAEWVARWDRQIATPYEGLSDQEREADREQVARYIDLIPFAAEDRAEGER